MIKRFNNWIDSLKSPQHELFITAILFGWVIPVIAGWLMDIKPDAGNIGTVIIMTLVNVLFLVAITFAVIRMMRGQEQ